MTVRTTIHPSADLPDPSDSSYQARCTAKFEIRGRGKGVASYP